MKFLDMLRMSSSNLWKRKVRTVLTVLGVVIGVASIVVMVSLGLGLRQSIMSDIENQGSLTTIEVSAPYNYDSTSDSAADKYLSQATADSLMDIEHVTGANPELDASVLIKAGRYISSVDVCGLSDEAMEKKKLKVGQGALPDSSDGELEFFYGNQIRMYFYVEKTGEMPYYDSGEIPDIDLMNDPISVIFDTEAYYSAKNPSDGTTPVQKPKKFMIPTAGIQEGDDTVYTNDSWSVFCNIDELEDKLRKVFKNKPIPGQPTTKSGKPFRTIYYSKILVDVDDIENVSSVMQQIQDLGYNAYSNAEWIQQEEKTMGYIQAVLGGIGAVSLLVAAIGIANTMMMSIYERTKEIGIMKVLGCDMKNIRTMFLMEAGYIGFIGGIVGVGGSYLISVVVNHVAVGLAESMTGSSSNISVIPPWLALLSIVFAIVIGMLAGFFPALRAMKLSPLAAIKNE